MAHVDTSTEIPKAAAGQVAYLMETSMSESTLDSSSSSQDLFAASQNLVTNKFHNLYPLTPFDDHITSLPENPLCGPG